MLNGVLFEVFAERSRRVAFPKGSISKPIHKGRREEGRGQKETLTLKGKGLKEGRLFPSSLMPLKKIFLSFIRRQGMGIYPLQGRQSLFLIPSAFYPLPSAFFVKV